MGMDLGNDQEAALASVSTAVLAIVHDTLEAVGLAASAVVGSIHYDLVAQNYQGFARVD